MVNFAYKATSDIKGSSVKVKNGSALLESFGPAERRMENRLRDLMLDIEDRIYQGTLGSVKVCRSLLGFVFSYSHFKGKNICLDWFTLSLCHYTLSDFCSCV